jgi:hypothetical protein
VLLSSRFDSTLKEFQEMTRRSLSILSLCLAFTVPAFGQYCAPSLANGCNGPGEEWIINVTFGSTNNATGCTPAPNYADYTALPAPLVTPGTSFPISVTVGNYWSGDMVEIYCDWDNNGNLNDAGETTIILDPGGAPSGSGASVVYNGTVNVPLLTGGPVRMRVVLSYFGPYGPCPTSSMFGFGEIEDYTVLTPGVAPCHLAFSSPFGPGSIQMDNTPCAPVAFADYINAITLAAGTYPNGWFFGLDIGWNQLVGEFQSGYPFSGTLDAAGSSTFLLPGGAPSGLQLWAVSVQFAPGFGQFLLARPPVTYTIP